MNNPKTDNLPVAPVVVSVLPASGYKLELRANEKEQNAIADFVDVVAVKSLSVDLKFSRWHKDGVKVAGKIRAELEQKCAVTLEPVSTCINEEFSALFVPEGSRLASPDLGPDGEWVLDPEGDDIPDTFVGDELDAWAIVLEHLQLFIDPYVRIEGAQLPNEANLEVETLPSSREDSDTPSPFAVLKAMNSLKKD